MKHSVVIPTLDEAANISVLLERLSETLGIYEVVIADGWTVVDANRDTRGVRRPDGEVGPARSNEGRAPGEGPDG